MLLPTVTLLASLDPLLRERAIAAAHAGDDTLVVVRHELTTLHLDGRMRRRSEHRSGAEEISRSVDERCCLSCLLRDDAEEALRGLAGRRVLLALPPPVEPANVATALVDAGAAHVSAIAAALDVRLLEARLHAPELLSSIEDLGDDPRTVAEVAARHLAHADVVLHDGADDRALALVDALSGGVPQRAVDDPIWPGVARHDHATFLARLQAGVPGCRGSVRRDGVEQRCWHRRRPLHPQRLLALLESDDLDGLARACGWLWVATRPGTVLELDACGGSYELGAVDAWLDAVDDHGPAHPARREVADRRWDPYYGDRAQDLVLTTLDRDLDEVVPLLDACLLTDAELADGPDVWRTWSDPLSPWLGDETELLRTVSEEPS
ncbi:GTP-binding protein [Egicoccus sp. AB-alg2]|uniref:GTP-binding protein n=1 Tax=Egicoccus sp. AB-alg2 TaxID=3242693 RepID=UPI00359DF965